tara:strand:+ start:4462 stop:4692 length:231 start_codon:yes stop_codon:yes gene_type:complete
MRNLLIKKQIYNQLKQLKGAFISSGEVSALINISKNRTIIYLNQMIKQDLIIKKWTLDYWEYAINPITLIQNEEHQ